MANYSKLSEKDVRNILSRYELKLEEHQAIEAGAGNSNYLVRTRQRRFILTVFEIPYARAARLCRVLSYLHKNKFPTSKVHTLPDGRPLSTYQDKAILLKSFLPGRNRKNLSGPMLKQIGGVMAALHELDPPAYLSSGHEYETDTLPALHQNAKHTAFVQMLVGKIRGIRSGIPADLPRGLIHGDIFFDNVVFEEDRLAGIIDFEDACRHFMAFDLGMAIVGLCAEGARTNLAKARALLSGYKQKRQLTKGERHTLQSLTEYAALLTAGWRFWKYHIDTPNQFKARKHEEMAAIAEHIHSIPPAHFRRAVFGISGNKAVD